MSFFKVKIKNHINTVSLAIISEQYNKIYSLQTYNLIPLGGGLMGFGVQTSITP